MYVMIPSSRYCHGMQTSSTEAAQNDGGGHHRQWPLCMSRSGAYREVVFWAGQGGGELAVDPDGGQPVREVP